MSTFAEVLAAQLRHEPGRPFITFYDQDSGERIELSMTTYANWVAKAAGLLAEEGDLERGQTLRLDLPPHWMVPVFAGAAWSIGAAVSFEGDGDVVVCGPDTLTQWAESGHDQVFACALAPLGGRFADGVPHGVHDVGIEIWSQPDAFTAWDAPGGDDVAVVGPEGSLSQNAMMRAATVGTLLTDGGRLLSVAGPASPPEVATFTEPLVRGGSLVLIRNPHPDLLDGVADAERVTHRV